MGSPPTPYRTWSLNGARWKPTGSRSPWSPRKRLARLRNLPPDSGSTARALQPCRRPNGSPACPFSARHRQPWACLPRAWRLVRMNGRTLPHRSPSRRRPQSHRRRPRMFPCPKLRRQRRLNPRLPKSRKPRERQHPRGPRPWPPLGRMQLKTRQRLPSLLPRPRKTSHPRPILTPPMRPSPPTAPRPRTMSLPAHRSRPRLRIRPMRTRTTPSRHLQTRRWIEPLPRSWMTVGTRTPGRPCPTSNRSPITTTMTRHSQARPRRIAARSTIGGAKRSRQKRAPAPQRRARHASHPGFRLPMTPQIATPRPPRMTGRRRWGFRRVAARHRSRMPIRVRSWARAGPVWGSAPARPRPNRCCILMLHHPRRPNQIARHHGWQRS